VIVDDEPLFRIGLARVLQSTSVRVVGEMADPLEGLAWSKAQGSDLIVLGKASRSMIEVVRRAKALPHAPVVIVLVSGHGHDELRGVLRAGADGLIVRSAGPAEIRSSVERLLAGERVVSTSLMTALVGAVEVAGSERSPAAGTTLTAKERQVLACLAGGGSNDEIASELFVSPATVKTHLAHIYGKLGARSRHEALARAVSLGILT
jgi:DNA-binding NarL/FixJ family response regulator